MAETVAMPKLGFDMSEGKVIRWLKTEGENVAKGEILAEIETDKATVEVEAQASGVLRKHLVAEGTSVAVGTAIALIGSPDEPIEAIAPSITPAAPSLGPTAPQSVLPAPSPMPGVEEGRLPAGARVSPLARRLAAEQGLKLADLQGSGPGGRIVRRDIEAALGRAPSAPAQGQKVALAQRIPLSKLRATIGRRMAAAKRDIPHVYLTIDLNAAPLGQLRREINAHLPEDGQLSVNDWMVKAAAFALRDMPSLNVSLEGDGIVRHSAVNIGIAVAVEEGLLTVVVRDADTKPIRLIAAEVREMAQRARQGHVRPQDIEGSTFTISNLGMFDVEHFMAIINPPEAAILAVGSVRDVPVLEHGELVPGQRLKVTLSVDHRVTDGAQAAQWLQAFRRYVEEPLRLLV